MEFENNWISYNGEIYNYLEIKKELKIEVINSTPLQILKLY